MKRFAYKAVTAEGQEVTGEMEAPDRSIVVDQLHASGYLPVSTEELADTPAHGALPLLGATRVRASDIQALTRELATMLNAGLPLAQALTNLGALSPKPVVRDLLDRIRTTVEGGQTLSEALAQSGGPFSKFYIHLVRAGEASGSLEHVLKRLAEHLHAAKQLREAVLSALLYPAILVFVAGASLLILLIYVVPQFEPLFADLGKALPISTQIVVAVAAALRGFWWLLPILGIIAYLVLHGMLDNLDKRRKWDRFRLRLPLLGPLSLRLELARVFRTLATLSHNGVALLDSVKLASETTNNLVLGDALDNVCEDLAHGQGFSQALAATARFPPLTIQLVRVGEETGDLTAMLLRLANIYEEDAQNAIKRFLSIIEPILILGMGLVIAFIIISILLAILGLNELVV